MNALEAIRHRHATGTDADTSLGVCDFICTKADVERPANKPVEIVTWATMESVDLEGEVVVASGLDTAAYLKNSRRIYADHEYGLTSAVAHCRSLSMKGDGWVCRGQMLNIDTEVSRAVLALANAEALGMSIGMQRKDSGAPSAAEAARYGSATKRVTRKSVLLELSYTAFPMNPSCNQIGPIQRAEKSRRAAAALKGFSPVVLDVFKVPRGVTMVHMLSQN